MERVQRVPHNEPDSYCLLAGAESIQYYYYTYYLFNSIIAGVIDFKVICYAVTYNLPFTSCSNGRSRRITYYAKTSYCWILWRIKINVLAVTIENNWLMTDVKSWKKLKSCTWCRIVIVHWNLKPKFLSYQFNNKQSCKPNVISYTTSDVVLEKRK